MAELLAAQIYHGLNAGIDPQRTSLLIATLSTFALLLWRFWRFTISPLLHPTRPKELPYWIPYIGHLRTFFSDYNAALESAREFFKDSKEPFSVWLAGARIYVLTNPEDVAYMYKNTKTISYHSMIKEMHYMIGVSDDGIDKLFTLDASHKHNADMTVPIVPALMTNEYHRRQLTPGPHLDDLYEKKIIPYIWNTLERKATAIENPQRIDMSDGTPVSLMALMVDLFDGGITSAFFGASIWEANPLLLRDFMVWEVTNWKWTFSMPNIISRDMVQAKDAIVNTFVKYLQFPAEKRSDSAYFVKSMEKMMRDVDVNIEDMAKTVMLHFWAVLGNTYKVAFWVFAYVIYDHDLLTAIRQEVEGAFKNGQYDEEYIFQNCPHLTSLVNETLRLAVASPLVRDVVQPTLVGGKVLEPGSRVMVPFHQLHRNRDVWGAEPGVLHSDRFLSAPKLLSSKSYRPFGGGSTLCPGRNMARRAIAFAVAGLINKFDIRIDIEKTNKLNGNEWEHNVPIFPKINHSKPSPGASLPFKNGDVILVLKGRLGTGL